MSTVAATYKTFLIHLALLLTVTLLAFLWFGSVSDADATGWAGFGLLIIIVRFGDLVPVYLVTSTALMFGLGALGPRDTLRLVFFGALVHAATLAGLIGFGFFRL